jgi:hypothetical protein
LWRKFTGKCTNSSHRIVVTLNYKSSSISKESAAESTSAFLQPRAGVTKSATLPESDAKLRVHHGRMAFPTFELALYMYPLEIGPRVRDADDTTVPIAWMVLNFDGWGTQLLSRTMAAGTEKTRPVTWSRRTAAIPIHKIAG